jgi:hypothetical protein
MYEHIKRYPWVLDIFHYQDQAHLLKSIESGIITPAEGWIGNQKK